ncbi:MAG: hypothetical protein J6T92_03885 [Ottowia sp.]|nr:hypothetical protein [Ottowia sp.]
MATLDIPALLLDEKLFAARSPALPCGEISELAVDKTTAGEALHPYARVIVLRLLDGKKVWEGFADAQGRWQADGLRPGFEYVAVGIDQRRVFKAAAAGPVRATVEGSNG